MANKTSSAVAPRHKFGIRLIFAFLLFLVVGLTAGTYPLPPDVQAATAWDYVDWGAVFIVTALAAISAGLVQEMLAIRRAVKLQSPPSDLRFAIGWELTWRLAAVAIFGACIVVQILRARHGLKLPKVGDLYLNGNIFPVFIGGFCLIAVLCEDLQRLQHPVAPRRRGRWIDAVVWVCLGALAMRAATNITIIQYLVHLACHGMDATLVHTGGRYGLLTVQQESSFAAAAIAASAAALIALAVVYRLASNPPASRRGRLWLAALGALSWGVAVGYCRWYFQTGLPMASPDLATGIAASWYGLACGVVLWLMLVTVGAHRLSRRREESDSTVLQATMPTSMRSALPTMACLIIATIIGAWHVADSLTGRFSRLSGGFSQWVPWYMELEYVLLTPYAYVGAAVGIFAVRIFRRQWRDRSGATTLQISPLSVKRFATIWLALAAVTAVAIPTFAALGFALWLGPWYRW